MKRSMRWAMTATATVGILLVTACTGGSDTKTADRSGTATASTSASTSSVPPSPTPTPTPTPTRDPNLLAGMPAPLSPDNVYAATGPNMLADAVKNDKAYVYVPNGLDNTVSVIDQTSMTVVNTFKTGNEPQHVVPSYDMRTLYVISDIDPGDGFLPINPATGEAGQYFDVTDPYNLYWTPDGQYAIVVAEYYKRLDFYTMGKYDTPHDSLSIPECGGINHIDFTTDGKLMLATCEFANKVAVVNVVDHTLIRILTLPQVSNGMPQDVKLSPDGQVFYVSDMIANGVYMIDNKGEKVLGFLPTGKNAHGLYIDRTFKRLFVTNRGEGTISIIDLPSRTVATKWDLGGGSPDMGNFSADGKVFWVSSRYQNYVYAVNADNGEVIKRVTVGRGPHGLTVWPQPGRYSLGHTGIMR